MKELESPCPAASNGFTGREHESGNPSLADKCNRIGRSLESFKTIAVAYSGGVDSTFLAWFAAKRLGKQVRAIFVDSPFIAERERDDALRTAGIMGLDLLTLELDPLQSAAVRQNPVDRCYHCKKEIFRRICLEALKAGCEAVVDGSHSGDAGSYRPGKRALSELGIISPLAYAGLHKEEIRRLSKEAGLPNWDKPSQSCLATRIPYGTLLSRPLLQRIEKAEDFLHALGFSQVRVRCHGDLARIEVEHHDFSKIILPEIRNKMVRAFRDIGFSNVSLDLAGFRSGSWDEAGTLIENKAAEAGNGE